MTVMLSENEKRLVRGATHEIRVIDAEEAIKLQDAIGEALLAYWAYLEKHNVVIDGYEMLIATCTTLGWYTELRNGALERLCRDTDDEKSITGDVDSWGKEDWPRPGMGEAE